MKNFYKHFLSTPPLINIFVIIFVFNIVIVFWLDCIGYGLKLGLLLRIIVDFFHVFAIEILLFFLLWLIFKQFIIQVSYFLLIVFTIFFIFESFLTLKFYSEFNAFILDAVIHTNIKEMFEFANFYIDIKSLLIVSFTILILFFCFKIKHVEFNRKRYLCFLILFLISVSVVAAVVKYEYSRNGKLFGRMPQSPIFRLFYVNFNYFYDKNNINNAKNIINSYNYHYNKNLKVDLKNENLPKNVVFIIGESLQRNYMSLYSYDIDTTPNLKKLQTSSNLIVFSDAVSPFTTTNLSLQRVLNFSSYEQEKPWFDSLNMVDMFKIRGYKTAWFSNQERFSIASGAAATVSKRADLIKFSNYSEKYTLYDEILLKIFNKFDSDKNFYIFHLMGSHTNYASRYPNEFDKFSSINLDVPLNNSQKILLKQYLNTIYYNDFIVNEIYNLFKDEDSLIVYISDHGENVFDINGVVGHGVVNRFVCEIPLIFIGSNKFITKHSDVWNALRKAKDKPFMTDDIIHTLADIIRFYPYEFRNTKSLLRDEFNVLRKRIVADKDYESVRYQKQYKN